VRLRSLLFVPGDRPDRFQKAIASDADGVVLDLEDAVAPSDKERARSLVADFCRTPRSRVYVRINAIDTPYFDQDLTSLRGAPIAGVLLPKAESIEAVERAGETGLPVLPLVETAAGFVRCESIGRVRGVQRLVFGHVDFQQDLRITEAGNELLFFRSAIVLYSRVCGLAAPLDGVTTAVDDSVRITADAEAARRLGFGGKLCIHPRQVSFVHQAFTPKASERAWAERVLQAVGEGGVGTIDGELVDRPMVLRARSILAQEK
jgi:citrate lyase subunit beta/citryl-CoA lyase